LLFNRRLGKFQNRANPVAHVATLRLTSRAHITFILSTLLSSLIVVGLSSQDGAKAAAPATPAEPTPLPTPSGLHESSAQLAQVLLVARKALGTPMVPVISEQIDATIAHDGYDESYSAVFMRDDYRVTTNANGLILSYGSYHGQRWQQNENGITTILAGVHRPAADPRRLAYDAMQNSILLGEVDAPASAFVVQAEPTDGLREWLFFDKSTGRLVHAQIFTPTASHSYDFDDYRTTNGVTLAWTIRSDSDTKDDRSDWTIRSDRFNLPIEPNSFIAPPSRAVVRFPDGVDRVRLPVRMEYGRFIVRVMIHGRGLDFYLDSGSSDVVIDREVAQELRLPFVGPQIKTSAGPMQLNAMVDDLSVGDIHMHDIVVDALPFHEFPDETTRAVGLLGFDFLAGAVLRLDYENGLIDAMRPSAFVAPAGAKPIDLALDDQVPMIECRLSNALAEHMIVDTGSYRVLVFSRFANAYFIGSPDPKKNVFRPVFFPLASGTGVGGFIPVAEYQLGSFQVGEYVLGGLFVYVTYHAPHFENEDTQGLFGTQVLAFFDVYFDYPDRRMYLLPNASAKAFLNK
jgi:hypothetical protein